MAGKPIAMNKYKELILLFQRRVSIKESARTLCISRNTVRRYRLQLVKHPHLLEELLAMEEPELSAWFALPPAETVDTDRYTEFVQRVPAMLAELKSKGVTKYLLWSEYRQECGEGYGYSQFCYYLRLQSKADQVSMVQHWEPGEVLFVDFAGHTMDVTDPHTGEAIARQIFLATMGHSQLTYASAIARQTVECFVEALENALQFFQGAPQLLVCDNLKSAVVTPDRYDPTLTRALADVAAHYNMVVMPARVSTPQDKSRVELGVKHFYQRVKAPLRKMNFFSDADLNKAITEKITASNNTPMQRSGASRQEVFNSKERSSLLPLPAQRFELKWRRSLMVQKNNHIYLARDKTYYSAPYIYVGRRVEVIYTATLVTIYADGKRVATHRRTYISNTYCTATEHMPKAHQAWASRSTQTYLEWAQDSGSQEIYTVVLRILMSKLHPQLAYRSCDAIMALYRRHGVEVLGRACAVALELDQCSYGFLSRHIKFLSKGHAVDAEPQAVMPQHNNIRGPGYYH